jgi:hypothetical protein
MQMSKVFENPEDLSEYLFRIVDNGGATADRYTVVFSDGSFLDMSGSPTHPQGVSMSGDRIDPLVLEEWVEKGEAVDLALGDLPEHIVQHILDRCNQGIADFLEAVEQKKPDAVASGRELAKANEGISTSLGEGLYVLDGKFMVKRDGDAEDDLGPYDTAREAILSTIPDQDGLSGPEYHSSTDVMRLTPHPDVTQAIADIEARASAPSL